MARRSDLQGQRPGQKPTAEGAGLEQFHRPRRLTVMPPPARGLNREEAARYVGVSPGKFDQLVQDNRMPKPIAIDARRVWDRVALDAAFDSLADTTEDRNPWDEVLMHGASE